MKVLQPPKWAKPKGYANGIAVRGELVFVAGVVGWNAEQTFETDCMAEQTQQTLENIAAILAQADAKPEHVVRMTWYITDKKEYLAKQKEMGSAYRSVMGSHYPVMAMLEVSALMEDRAKVEIEATAVIPDLQRAI
jgi:enamine deaminase RidA (YjgF/YER057c/UK114 family)